MVHGRRGETIERSVPPTAGLLGIDRGEQCGGHEQQHSGQDVAGEREHGARAEREGGSNGSEPMGRDAEVPGPGLSPRRRRLSRRGCLEGLRVVLVRLHQGGAGRLVQGARAVDVVLHGMEKAPIAGELRERLLRVLVEIAVVLELA